ncbi:MAG: hypothetical protein IJ449_03725 [Clostridia bacterium]|nr:hypothetical protein [Clostridia bacterium]
MPALIRYGQGFPKKERPIQDTGAQPEHFRYRFSVTGEPGAAYLPAFQKHSAFGAQLKEGFRHRGQIPHGGVPSD